MFYFGMGLEVTLIVSWCICIVSCGGQSTTFADLLTDVFVYCIGSASDVNVICPEPKPFIFSCLYKLQLLYNVTHVFRPCPQTSHFIPVGPLFILYTFLHDINITIGRSYPDSEMFGQN